ncbi:DUF397 domain-containing protein [Actinomadura sp. LD22]|uniref:DUF397 domain-containing protein n=1 Tax=Actinomadura physcomitrii TaxID=2650748 RepID=A0A6I4M3U4_9ACTN|nr:DUF397 domain-containing protein [Actinomadura physcomitrii]MVZ99044.1 DUF397 domain-containing protein [Actinomadura physcomitrii]
MSLHADLPKARWRKASRSSSTGSDCVEVANSTGGVAVRDSKIPEGPKLFFGREAWRDLAERVSRGELDLS